MMEDYNYRQDIKETLTDSAFKKSNGVFDTLLSNDINYPYANSMVDLDSVKSDNFLGLRKELLKVSKKISQKSKKGMKPETAFLQHLGFSSLVKGTAVKYTPMSIELEDGQVLIGLARQYGDNAKKSDKQEPYDVTKWFLNHQDITKTVFMKGKPKDLNELAHRLVNHIQASHAKFLKNNPEIAEENKAVEKEIEALTAEINDMEIDLVGESNDENNKTFLIKDVELYGMPTFNNDLFDIDNFSDELQERIEEGDFAEDTEIETDRLFKDITVSYIDGLNKEIKKELNEIGIEKIELSSFSVNKYHNYGYVDVSVNFITKDETASEEDFEILIDNIPERIEIINRGIYEDLVIEDYYKTESNTESKKDIIQKRKFSEYEDKLEKQADSKKSGQALASSNIKKELKLKFPKTKFKVTSESFSSGTAVDISWKDGETVEEVREVTDKYQYGNFNGMEDIYERNSNVNETFGSAKYVQAQRSYSQEATKYIINDLGYQNDVMSTEYGLKGDTDKTEKVNSARYNTNFSDIDLTVKQTHEITEENISEFYPTMSDEDKDKNAQLIDDMFSNRLFQISKGIGIDRDNFGAKGILDSETYDDFTFRQSLFGVEDSLQPIEEYIAEIKDSDAYKDYVSSRYEEDATFTFDGKNANLIEEKINAIDGYEANIEENGKLTINEEIVFKEDKVIIRDDKIFIFSLSKQSERLVSPYEQKEDLTAKVTALANAEVESGEYNPASMNQGMMDISKGREAGDAEYTELLELYSGILQDGRDAQAKNILDAEAEKAKTIEDEREKTVEQEELERQSAKVSFDDKISELETITNSDELENALDTLAEEIEASGEIEKYEEKLGQIADKITELMQSENS